MIEWKYYLTQFLFYGSHPMHAILQVQRKHSLYAYQVMMGTDVVKNFLFAVASDDARWPYECFDLARMFHKPHARFFHLIMASFSLLYTISLFSFRNIPRLNLLNWFSIHLKQDWIDGISPNNHLQNELQSNSSTRRKIFNQLNIGILKSDESKWDVKRNQLTPINIESKERELFSGKNPKSLYDASKTFDVHQSPNLVSVSCRNSVTAFNRTSSFKSTRQDCQSISSTPAFFKVSFQVSKLLSFTTLGGCLCTR